MGRKRKLSQFEDGPQRKKVASSILHQDEVIDTPQVSIVLHGKVVYKISKDILLQQNRNALSVMMSAGMREAISDTITLSDVDSIFTAETIKMFFGALAFGSSTILHAPYHMHHFMTLPLLVVYYWVDVDIAAMATTALKRKKLKVRHINKAIRVLCEINRHIAAMEPPTTEKSEKTSINLYHQRLMEHRSVLYELLAKAFSRRFMYLKVNCWSLMSVKDMYCIIRLLSHTARVKNQVLSVKDKFEARYNILIQYLNVCSDPPLKNDIGLSNCIRTLQRVRDTALPDDDENCPFQELLLELIAAQWACEVSQDMSLYHCLAPFDIVRIFTAAITSIETLSKNSVCQCIAAIFEWAAAYQLFHTGATKRREVITVCKYVHYASKQLKQKSLTQKFLQLSNSLVLLLDTLSPAKILKKVSRLRRSIIREQSIGCE